MPGYEGFVRLDRPDVEEAEAVGPYETRHAAVQAWRAGAFVSPEALLLDTCAAAGVEVGEYDEQVLSWLAGWEPERVLAVAGLIARAAGERDQAIAAELRRIADLINRDGGQESDAFLKADAGRRQVARELVARADQLDGAS